MKSSIYDQAKYYEIAFGFVNPKKQGNLFEEFIKKYSLIKVKAVLDICCGTALQLREMARRGYRSIGLDSNSKMLDYLKKESVAEGIEIETVRGDMNSFTFRKKVDFAYIMMGSIVYVGNNISFLSHLDSVARSLHSGGLYLMENVDINWADPSFWKSQTWTMRRGKIKVKTTFQLIPKNMLLQSVTQVISLDVDDNGKKSTFVEKTDVAVISPEEFKLLIEKNKQFEFIGFFERDKVRLLRKSSSHNIALLRRR